MKALLLTGFVVLTGTAQAFAADNGRPYGVGGCGLGSMIMGKDGNQVLAITTNGSSFIQHFAITSGTSNCVDSGVVAKQKEARAFIESNRQTLANDISKGGGESLSSLAKIYRCGDEKALGLALKQNYQVIFPNSSASIDQVEGAIQNVIKNEAKGSCLG